MENEKQHYNGSQTGSETKETFPVEGMTCAGCASGVERSLTNLEGVKSAEVSLDDASATVAYDPGSVTPELMQQAVEKAGFKLGKPGDSGAEKPKRSGGCC